MHEKVFLSLLNYYNEYKASPRYQKNVGEYLISRIVRMGGCQLSAYLSFPADQERKEILYSFFDEFSRLCPDAYLPFSRLKTVRILRFSRALYRPFSAFHRRRLGL